jgi:hypothetical protein
VARECKHNSDGSPHCWEAPDHSSGCNTFSGLSDR